MDQTTPSAYGRNGTALITYIFPFAVAVSLGTGAAYTKEFVRAREANLIFVSASSIDSDTQFASIVADINHVKSVLKLTMAEIAECVGVTRQSLYNWRSGGVIKADNREKLENLRKAADVIAASKVGLSSFDTKRKLRDGKSLSEAVAAGQDGEKVAAALAEMLQNESARRAEIASRFAGRLPFVSHDDAPPVLDE